ncbi:T9SS type A sorting domain-containing protein [Flavobacterium sp.]|uniref:T9SS type A sorting domain-containing protein n=1 Tax=Flavobacterium sp. TaxID=239 RepID=UPI0039E2C669
MNKQFKRLCMVLCCALLFGTGVVEAQQLAGKTEPKTTTWDGSNWSNGIPDKETKAIFAADFTTDENLVVYDLEVRDGKKVTFNGDAVLRVTNNIVVAPTGNVSLRANAQLLQDNPNSVNSAITVQRTTRITEKFDYTYFCAPVDGQVMEDIGVDTGLYLNPYPPGYVGPLFDKYFYWDETATPAGTDAAIYNTGRWQNVASSSTMDPAGRGYIIRGPQSFASPYQDRWVVEFTGEPHNGTITKSISGGAYTPCVSKMSPNLIGNPYPSALDADSFLTHPDNITHINGALMMWTHNTPISPNFPGNGTAPINYTRNDYVMYNLTGGIGTGRVFNDPIYGPDNSNRPTGKIASCQGFFVMGLSSTGGVATFTNDMRDYGIATADQQFYKGGSVQMIAPLEKNRIWLSLESGSGGAGSLYKETLVGYMPAATTTNGNIAGSVNTYDKMYDAEVYTAESSIAFYTMIAAATPCPKLGIQGRTLGSPFNNNDVVPIGFTCPAGTYTIRAEKFDGIFGAKAFFLREKTGVDGLGNPVYAYHNIKHFPFTFTTSTTTTDDITRFALVFKPGNIQLTRVVDPLCNGTLDLMSKGFTAQNYASDNGNYRWIIQRADGLYGPTPLDITTNTWKLRVGNPDLLPIGFMDFDTEYIITVGLYKNGNWYFGDTCHVRTPKNYAWVSLHNCGDTGLEPSGGKIQLATTARDGAPQGFLWEITNTSTGAVQYVKTGNPLTAPDYFFYFNVTWGGALTLAPAISNFVALNTTYTFRSALNYNMAETDATAGPPAHGKWSDLCSFSTGNSWRAIAAGSSITNASSKDFEAFASPNPFNDQFNIDIYTQATGPVQIQVFDILGKLVENRTVDAAQTVTIGNRYAAGIYNVIVTQGDNKQNLKLVKN